MYITCVVCDVVLMKLEVTIDPTSVVETVVTEHCLEEHTTLEMYSLIARQAQEISALRLKHGARMVLDYDGS